MRGRNTPLQYFLAPFIPMFIIGVGVLFYWDWDQTNDAREQLIQSEQHKIALKNEFITNYFDPLLSDIFFLSQSLSGQEFDTTATSLHLAETTFRTFMKLNPDYYQIRLLDSLGMEQVKVIRKGKLLITTPTDELQNKADRDYFKEGKQTKANQVYVSNLDLNIEADTIETPYRPVVRLITHTSNGNLIISNYDLYIFINRLKSYYKMVYCQYSLINEDGYWLLGPEEYPHWGFMFHDSTATFQNHYPQVWQQMQQQVSGYVFFEEGYYIFGKNDLRQNIAKLASEKDIEITLSKELVLYSLAYVPASRVDAVIHAHRKNAWPFLLTIVVLITGTCAAFAYSKSRDEKQRHKLSTLNEELVMNEAILKERNKDLNQFNQIASRDLKTPIAKIRAYLESEQKELAGKTDQKTQLDALAITLKAVSKTENLIGQLSHLQDLHLFTLDEEIDVQDMLLAILQQLKQLIQEKDAHIQIDTTPLTIVADKGKIQTVFRTLIEYSLDNTPDTSTPEINIGIQHKPRKNRFTLTNNARSIDPAYQYRVFNMEEGDIDLAVCAAIVKQHGGKIWLHKNSQYASIGNTFIFTIPSHR